MTWEKPIAKAYARCQIDVDRFDPVIDNKARFDHTCTLIDPLVILDYRGATVQRIRDNIYIETGFIGCNPGFVTTSGGVVMIDTPQKPSEASAWKKEIQKHGQVRYIINTDHHRDHALGNTYFNGDIIMHEGTMKRLHGIDDSDQDIPSHTINEDSKRWIAMLEPQSTSLIAKYVLKKPTLTYRDRMTIYSGCEVFELIHVTSHTRDETIVYMPGKKVLFTGDTVCTNGIPGLGESYLKDWIEALGFIEGLDFDILVPGHGKIGDKGSIEHFRNELNLLVEKVRARIDKGLSRDKIVEQITYVDHVHKKYPPAFSKHFQNFMKKSIKRLYDELV